MRDPHASADDLFAGNSSDHAAARQPWERHLSWRGWLLRVGGMVLALSVLALLLVGTGAVAQPKPYVVHSLLPIPAPMWSPTPPESAT